MPWEDVNLYPEFEQNLSEAEHAQMDTQKKQILNEEEPAMCKSSRVSKALTSCWMIPLLSQRVRNFFFLYCLCLFEAPLTEVKYLKKTFFLDLFILQVWVF